MTILTTLPADLPPGPRRLAAEEAVRAAVRLLGAERVRQIVRAVEAAQRHQKRGRGRPKGSRNAPDHVQVGWRHVQSYARRYPAVPLDVVAARVAHSLRPYDPAYGAELAAHVATTAAGQAAAAKARAAAAQAAYHAEVLANFAGRPMPEGFTAVLATLPQS